MAFFRYFWAFFGYFLSVNELQVTHFDPGLFFENMKVLLKYLLNFDFWRYLEDGIWKFVAGASESSSAARRCACCISFLLNLLRSNHFTQTNLLFIPARLDLAWTVAPSELALVVEIDFRKIMEEMYFMYSYHLNKSSSAFIMRLNFVNKFWVGLCCAWWQIWHFCKD